MLRNLKPIRLSKKLDQIDVAEGIGISINTYRNWEQLKNMPKAKSVRKLADFFGVTIDELVGSDYGVVSPALASPRMSYIPVYGRIAAGVPLDMDETDDVAPIPIEVMRKHPNAFLLRVEGESMSNVLPNGCLALVDPDRRETIINGNAYAVCVNGYAATIKRVVKLANGFELMPDSKDPTYKPVLYDYGVEGTELITVIGEVVWYTLPFDFVI